MVAEPSTSGRLAIDNRSSDTEIAEMTSAWVEAHVPEAWRRAADDGIAAIRSIRTRAAYEDWYPVFGESGMVVPTWPVEYGGLALSREHAEIVERTLAPYHLGRLNPLGLNLCASALFAHGSEAQRVRYLGPIVRNEEKWCQLFSEPGAGSDLGSLGTRAVRDGDSWIVTGQKVWTTWAHVSDWAVLLARTDPEVPKRKGITYFLLELDQPGVDVRPLRHLTGEIDFNEVFLDGAVVPDHQRVGDVNDGWRVAGSTLASERQMVAGAGSGGVDRIGGTGVEHAIALASERGSSADPIVRQHLAGLVAEEQIRSITNRRVRAQLAVGRAPGPESSVGKVHSGDLNQRLQLATVDLLQADALAWEHEEHEGADARAAYAESLRREVHGMLRSRANTIEGGTTEVNKNIVGERVLGLPREPDPWTGIPWNEVPRS